MESTILASSVNSNIKQCGVNLEHSVEMSITVDLSTDRGRHVQMSEMWETLGHIITHKTPGKIITHNLDGWPSFFRLGIISIVKILQNSCFFVEIFSDQLFAIKKIPNTQNQIFKRNKMFLREETSKTNTLLKTRTKLAF